MPVAQAPLADGTLQILFLGSPAADLQQSAALVEEEFRAAGVDSVETAVADADTLLGYYYGWTGRAERLATLRGDWDVVVLADEPSALVSAPELHFEGMRALSAAVHRNGAATVQVITSQVPAETEPQEIAWRIAVGTGSLVASAGVVSELTGGTPPEIRYFVAASVFTSLTGQSAAVSGYAPDGVAESRWQDIADATLSLHDVDETSSHYSGPYSGVVRIDSARFDEPYRYIRVGTSSEAGWADAMGAMLAHENIAHVSTSAGNCNPVKAVDDACEAAVAQALETDQYQVLYARDYFVSQESIRTASNAPDLSVQVYDRHWDGTDNPGIDALDDVFNRSFIGGGIAYESGAAWLPQHINFGKLKAEHADANLLTDGTHATAAVQRGLAAMSYVSRTGVAPTLTGLTGEVEAAVRLGEETIRTMATLSSTGRTVADLPENRATPPDIPLQ